MKIISKYVADDGTEFDNEFDCINYEFYQKSKLFNINIKVYNGRKRIHGDIWTDDVYNTCTRVVIEDDYDLKFIKLIQDYCGFYIDINSVGVWKWDSEKQCFKKK